MTNVAIKLHNQDVAENARKRTCRVKENILNNRRSWFVLTKFCTTSAITVTLGCALLFTSAAAAYAFADGGRPPKAATQEAGNPKERTFAGLITDDHCGARHDMDSGKSSTECTKMCVRNGSKYVLVEGNKRYALAGSESKLDELAGQRVKVAGVLDGKTIKLSSTNSGQ
jgi:hypothetical protein